MTMMFEYENDFERFVNELYDSLNSWAEEVYGCYEWELLSDEELRLMEWAFRESARLAEDIAKSYGVEVY